MDGVFHDMIRRYAGTKRCDRRSGVRVPANRKDAMALVSQLQTVLELSWFVIYLSIIRNIHRSTAVSRPEKRWAFVAFGLILATHSARTALFLLGSQFFAGFNLNALLEDSSSVFHTLTLLAFTLLAAAGFLYRQHAGNDQLVEAGVPGTNNMQDVKNPYRPPSH